MWRLAGGEARALRKRDTLISYVEPSLSAKMRQISDDEEQPPSLTAPEEARECRREKKPSEGPANVARKRHGGTPSSIARWAGRVAGPVRPLETASRAPAASGGAGHMVVKGLGKKKSEADLHRVRGTAQPQEGQKVCSKGSNSLSNICNGRRSSRFRCPAPHIMCVRAHAMYAMYARAHARAHKYTLRVGLTSCVSLCSVQHCVRVCERVSRANV